MRVIATWQPRGGAQIPQTWACSQPPLNARKPWAGCSSSLPQFSQLFNWNKILPSLVGWGRKNEPDMWAQQGVTHGRCSVKVVSVVVHSLWECPWATTPIATWLGKGNIRHFRIIIESLHVAFQVMYGMVTTQPTSGHLLAPSAMVLPLLRRLVHAVPHTPTCLAPSYPSVSAPMSLPQTWLP